ncbi:MAG: hypothetical protein WBC04_19505 [Candidatus Acidiferrales bacterium]
MKPIFTIHEGEFLVGDHINRKFGRKYNVWVPTKDSGVDLLVTRKTGEGKPVGLQVKFSRSFDIPDELTRHVLATSWYTLDPKKISQSQADLWVFVFMTLRHQRYFVLLPTSELKKRIPRGCGSKWNLYLWAYADGSCYQVRDLNLEGRLKAAHRGVQDRNRDFSKWFENWKLLEKFSRQARPINRGAR